MIRKRRDWWCSRLIVPIIAMLSCAQCSMSDRCYLIHDMDCECRHSMLICETEKHVPQLELTRSSETAAMYRQVILKFKVGSFNVPPRFFHPLNRLLVIPGAPGESDPVSVSLTFSDFIYLSLEPRAFDGIFDGIPQNLTKLSIDLYSQRPATVSKDTFHGLSVGYLELSGSTLDSNPPASFEALFNHTSVSLLFSLEGLLLHPLPGRNFQGSINRLTFSKQVQVVNAKEYPKFPVKFYAIGAHNARHIEGDSFYEYDNLRGLIIHGGNIELSGNNLRGFRRLEELDLDLEKVENGTLAQISPTLRLLRLGRRVKHIDTESIKSLSGNLRQLDIRNVDFEMLSYPTRCAICDLVNTGRYELNVLVDNEGCECHHLFILMIKQIRPLCRDPDYVEHCARYAQCQVVKDYFSELWKIPRGAFADVMTVNSTYLSQLQRQHQRKLKEAARGHSTVATINGPAIVVDIGSDQGLENRWMEQGYPERPMHSDRPRHEGAGGVDRLGRPSTDTNLNWIPVVVVCVTLIISLAVALLIWNMNYRRRRGHFKPIPANSHM